MKLALITPRLHMRGGTEKIMLFLSRHLALNGWEVHVFCSYAEDVDDIPNLVVHKIPIPQKPGILNYVLFLILNTILRFLRKIFLRERFDIVAATGGDSFSSDVLLAMFCQARRLYDMKNGIYSLPSGTLPLFLRKLHITASTIIARFVEEKAYRSKSLKLVIALSKDTCRDISRFYNPSVNCSVVYNPVDTEIYNPIRRKNLRESLRKKMNLSDEKIFLFVGGDWERKGVPYLVKAFVDGEIYKRARLWIVGNGMRSSLRPWVDTEGIDIFSPTGEVWKFYFAADFFIFPTLYDTGPNVIVEAMASGLPTAASVYAGVSELAEDGREMIKIKDPSDTAELIRTMDVMLKNTDDIAKMAEAGAKLMSKRTPVSVNREIEQLLRQVVERL